MDPNAKNKDGDTPLHTACRNGTSDQVQLLVRDKKCNPNDKNSYGDTALHVACCLSCRGQSLPSSPWCCRKLLFAVWPAASLI